MPEVEAQETLPHHSPYPLQPIRSVSLEEQYDRVEQVRVEVPFAHVFQCALDAQPRRLRVMHDPQYLSRWLK